MFRQKLLGSMLILSFAFIAAPYAWAGEAIVMMEETEETQRTVRVSAALDETIEEMPSLSNLISKNRSSAVAAIRQARLRSGYTAAVSALIPEGKRRIFIVSSPLLTGEELADRWKDVKGVVSAVPAKPIYSPTFPGQDVSINESASGDLVIVPDDPQYKEQYGLKMIGAPEAWTQTVGTKDVYAIVMDSGIDVTHPDLSDNISPLYHNGWNPSTPVSLSPLQTIEDYYVSPDIDLSGHGTHVAGIIGAKGDNALGVAGVSWNSNLISYRVITDTGSTTAVLRGFESLAALLASDANLKIAAINLSITFYIQNNPEAIIASEDPIWTAIKAISDTNRVLIVVSAGNEGLEVGEPAPQDSTDSTLPYVKGDFVYPASYAGIDNFMVVGAVGKDSRSAEWSNYSEKFVSILAPGEDIVSTTLRNSYFTLNGTSMAAPHVSGAAILLKSLFPSATASELKAAMMKSVSSGIPTAQSPLNVENKKAAASSILNIPKAIKYMEDTHLHPEPVPTPQPNPFDDEGAQSIVYDLNARNADIIGEPLDRRYDKPVNWNIAWFGNNTPTTVSASVHIAAEARTVEVATTLLPTIHQITDIAAVIQDKEGKDLDGVTAYVATLRTEKDSLGRTVYTNSLSIRLPAMDTDEVRNKRWRLTEVKWRRQGWSGTTRIVFSSPGVELDDMEGFDKMFIVAHEEEYDNDLFGGGCHIGLSAFLMTPCLALLAKGRSKRK